MIRLSCTNCREVLTIDDAFAGGVCRCQHCGTIQTVPATAGAATNGVATGGPDLGGGRNGPVLGGAGFGGTAHEGTGLDDLAGAIVSSGLQSNRLRRPDAAGGQQGVPHRRHNPVPLLVTVGLIVAVLTGAIVYMGTRPTSMAVPAAGPDGSTLPAVANRPPPKPVSPNFCGTPLAGQTVVYVLDRGTATAEVFAALKDATLASVRSLGSGRQFQIVFWDNGGDPAVYPPDGATYASAENVEAARVAIDPVPAYGQTDLKPALAVALARHPDVVVVATSKGWSLDAAWADDVLAARGKSAAPIDTFSLGGTPTAAGDATPGLKQLAERTGGQYTVVSTADLSAAGR